MPVPAVKNSERRAGPKSAATRLEILRAAARLLRDQGYAATTLRQIGEAANKKAGSIYYYFDSKDDIFNEVLNEGLIAVFDAVRDAVEAAPADATHRQRLERAMKAHLDMLHRKGEFTAATIRSHDQLPPKLRQRHRKWRSDYGAYWDGLFTKAIEAGDVREDFDVVPLRMFVVGAMNWTVEWFDAGKYDPDDLYDLVSKLLMQGMETHKNSNNC